MKWVKASEPPKKEGEYFVHAKDGASRFMGVRAFKQGLWFAGTHDEVVVEWLEETEDKETKEIQRIGDGRIVIDGETYVNEKSSRVIPVSQFKSASSPPPPFQHPTNRGSNRHKMSCGTG